MDPRYSDRIDALARTWEAWAATAAGLDGGQWAAPSRCTGWDVAALYAHVGMFPYAVRNAPPTPDDPGPSVTAPQILRGFNAEGGVATELAGEVADAAVTSAAELGAAGLRAAFAEEGPRAVAECRAHGATDPVPWPAIARVTTWGEAIRIVLLESTVHLLDVRHALGSASRDGPGVPDAALQETAHLLAEVADPVGFVEAATGRTSEAVLPLIR